MRAISDAQIADAIAKMKASKAFRTISTRLDFVAVCLVGYRHPVPIRIGSNATKWPVKVVTSRDPENAANRADLEQPLHELMTLEFVWTESEAHARRLKAALDDALLGKDPTMVELRHSWRDCSEPSIAWGVLLSEALRAIRKTGQSMEVFSEQMRVQRVANEMRRGQR